MRFREQIERHEASMLAPYGQRSNESRGRLHPQPEHTYRTAFQRDRDRILHSSAFRRLQFKTQVFSYGEGDHYRNRLTHTLEVSQIARTIARALGANEDLTEAIVLAHDLGHPPFGHPGERVMHALLADVGGFEHNRQSLRLIDWLETRTSAYRGLNLTHETRAGLLKHGADFPRYSHPVPLPELRASPGVEAQIANLADEIAYHAHDLDDAIRADVIGWDALAGVSLVEDARAQVQADGLDEPRVLRARVVVSLIDRMTSDLIEASWKQLQASQFASADAVLDTRAPVVVFSEAMRRATRALARFLMAHFYRHPRVLEIGARAERVLADLFAVYTASPGELPAHVRRGSAPEEGPLRAVGDYIAGMTDRFALEEHRRRVGG